MADARLTSAVRALEERNLAVFPGDLFSFVFAKLDGKDGAALRVAVAGGADCIFNKKQRSLLRSALKNLGTDEEHEDHVHPDLNRDCEELTRQFVAGRRDYGAIHNELEAFLGASLVLTGSMAVGVHLPCSDLDLCLSENSASSLDDVAARLKTSKVDARVPIVKTVWRGVECDICCASGGSIRKAEVMRDMVESLRARDLVLLVKHWSNVRGLSNSAAFGVNSYAWAMMVVAYLRKCNEEKASLGQRLLGVFEWMLTVDWRSGCVTLAAGDEVVIAKPEEIIRSGTPTVMCVQDPVFPSENCTRTVTGDSLPNILAELVRARCMLSSGASLAEVLAAPESKRAVLNAKWMKHYVEPVSIGASSRAVATVQPLQKTVEFLQTRGLEALVGKYSLVAKRHAKWPHLVQLSYMLSTSPMASPIVGECRGLIVDEQRRFAVVSYPFSKFFNHREPKCARLDWSSVRIYPKLDGSIMTMYYYGGCWNVASQRRPDGGGCFEDEEQKTGITMADMFWQIFGGKTLPRCGGRYCYMFEMCSSANRIVVSHEKDSLTLIGIRSLETLTEVRLEEAGDLVPADWNVVAPLALEHASAEQVTKMARELCGTVAEGFVAVDAQFNRAKIKAPSYVQLALLKCEPNAAPATVSRRLLALAMLGETEEVAAYFPQHAEELARLAKLLRRLREGYALNKPLLHRFRSSRCVSFDDFLATLSPREVEAILEEHFAAVTC